MAMKEAYLGCRCGPCSSAGIGFSLLVARSAIIVAAFIVFHLALTAMGGIVPYYRYMVSLRRHQISVIIGCTGAAFCAH